MQASGTPASTSILPEYLASVIHAIQTPISAIVQQSLAAVVGAHSVSQGFPAITPKVLPFLLVRLTWVHVAFINLALHRFLLGFLSGISSSLVFPSFVPVFSSASLSSIGHYRNVRGLGRSIVVFRLFEKLRHSNETSTIF